MEAADDRTNFQNFPVEAFARAVAAQIAIHESDGRISTPEVTVRPRQPVPAAPVDASFSFGIDVVVDIKIGDNTYSLTVKSPPAGTTDWEFELLFATPGKQPATIVSWKWSSADNWALTVAPPFEVAVGPVTFKTLNLKISRTPATLQA